MYFPHIRIYKLYIYKYHHIIALFNKVVIMHLILPNKWLFVFYVYVDWHYLSLFVHSAVTVLPLNKPDE